MSDEDEPQDEHFGFTVTELEWCVCGEAIWLDDVLFRYLSQGDGSLLEVHSDTERIMAYVADSKGWTEHGSVIDYSWLTDEGRKALGRLRELRSRPA